MMTLSHHLWLVVGRSRCLCLCWHSLLASSLWTIFGSTGSSLSIVNGCLLCLDCMIHWSSFSLTTRCLRWYGDCLGFVRFYLDPSLLYSPFVQGMEDGGGIGQGKNHVVELLLGNYFGFYGKKGILHALRIRHLLQMLCCRRLNLM